MTQVQKTDAAAPARAKDRSLLWWVLSLLLGLYMVEFNFEWTLRSLHIQPGIGQIGMSRQLDETSPPGFMNVVAILPGSPAERAGIQVGDHVRYVRSGAINRQVAVGEAVPIIQERDGVRRELTLIADARPFGIEHMDWPGFIGVMALNVSIILGLVIIARSRGKVSALWLGVALAVFGGNSIWPTFWTSWFPLFWFVAAFQWFTYALLPIALLQFAMHFYRENVGPLRASTRATFLVYAAAVLLSMAVVFFVSATSTWLPLVGGGRVLSSAVVYLGLIAAGWLLFLGWRRSSSDVQQRYAIMLLGIGMILISQAVQTTFYFLIPVAGGRLPTGLWIDISNWLSGVIAPSLLAYAVLRHRVFDLGFAVNRTLIFSIVSAILLLAFGLAEWFVNERLGIAALRDNPLVAAAIALVLFLTFHNIHGAVERVVEGVFFRTWREKEATLKRFVREAGFMLKGDVLERDFIAALRRFSDGAEAALYQRNEDGAYARIEGVVAGAPELVDADEPLVVALRTDRAATGVRETRSALQAALALPMVIRHEIDGFVLMGDKPSGLAYRPDEREELAKAAEAVGDDLHALKVEQLQRGIANLEARNDELRAALRGVQAPNPA